MPPLFFTKLFALFIIFLQNLLGGVFVNVITKGNGNYAAFFHWSAVVEIAFYTVEPFAEGVAVLIYEPEAARRRLAVCICGNVGNFSGTISNTEVFSVVENDIFHQ